MIVQGPLTRALLAKLIDHTNLSPTATSEDIGRLSGEAIEHDCASVCVASGNVRFAANYIRSRGSRLVVCSVVGFPHGNMSSRAKAYETTCAVEDGATEIDMVIDQGAWRAGKIVLVRHDIEMVVAAARKGGATVKVIFETAALRDGLRIVGLGDNLTRSDQIAALCDVAKNAGATFVKTSSGFGGAGATIEDVTAMRQAVGPDFGVKASGGIGTYEAAKAMIEAGATRIGASKTLDLLAAAPE